MKRNSFKRIVLALSLLFCLSGALESMAQTKPLWASKGEKSLNKKRQSDNYTFKVFNTHDLDEAKLKNERLNPLLEYLQQTYGVETSQMTVDTTAVAADGSQVVKVTMPENGTTSFVYAKRIDEFSEFTDYELNVFQYEYYQLYAVSEKNAAPEFDDIEVVETNNKKALACSIIPGFGQFYKGQYVKGAVILGGEIALVSAALVSQKHKHKADNHGWESKSRGWRQMRNMSITLACGLYVYNLIDAATSKAGRRITVGKNKQGTVAVLPWSTLDCGGLSLAIRF